MNKIIVLTLMMLARSGNAAPYVQGIWIKENPLYFTQGAIFAPSNLKYQMAFTNLAFLYHPLSAGSLLDRWPAVEKFIPPESWACTVGVGYLPANSQASVGVGCGVNLLDSVRAWTSNILLDLNNETLARMGEQIKPGNGPLNLYASRQENISLGGKFVPAWFFGGSLRF